ncbi:MAG: DUF1735 domain-containing protein [Niabella sp.]|nr:DUF1735 domain-containing protein [Niabella sp.]
MKRNLYKYYCSAVIIAAAVIGCVKDTDFDKGVIQSVHSDQTQNVIFIGNTVTSTSNYLQLSYDKSAKDTTVQIMPVTLANANPAPQDIIVVLVPNNALLGASNDANATSLEPIPADKYTISNPKSADGAGYLVTIAKGTSTGYLQVKFVPNNLLGGQYALGFQIASIQTAGYVISSNLSKAVTGIGIKNEFDGKYDYKGYSLRAGDNSLTGYFSGKTMTLITSGGSSVTSSTLPLWGDGVSGIAIGNISLAVNNSGASPYPVTITSSGGATNAPGYNSRYDAATKTFYISFTWGAGPAARLSTDTLTYNSPR